MAERRAAAAQANDRELVELLLRFSRAALGAGWLDDAMEEFRGIEDPRVEERELQLAMPWALHVYPAGEHDETVSALFRAAKGRHLSPEMRELLDAQIASWCSLWCVEEVHRGKGAWIRDLLSEERRYVHEKLGTEDLPVDLVLLGRVVDVNGISFLAGVHPQPLPSDRTFALVTAARRHFRVRTRPVKPERLRDQEFQLWLIDEWRKLDEAMRRPPELRNTDGDPLEPTVDHFTFDVARRDELIVRLVTIPGAEEPEESEPAEGEADADGEVTIVVTRAANRRNAAMENTIVGVLLVGDGKLRADTNSAKRADKLRRAVTKAAGALVTHRLRETTSLEQMFGEAAAQRQLGARGAPPAPRPPQPPEALEVVREYKRRHYAAWVDDRIPALGGLTPREAARSPKMREQLENLLRRMEQGEAALPVEERADVGAVRRELGM